MVENTFSMKKTFLPSRFATQNMYRSIENFILKVLVYNTLYVCEHHRLHQQQPKRNFFFNVKVFVFIALKFVKFSTSFENM
jgi:hypothetical protein